MKFAMASSFVIAAAQQKGTMTPERHPSLSYSSCTATGCQQLGGKVTIDSNWRWLHSKSGAQNCYTGNQWDATLCPDSKTCTQNCVLEGADAEYAGTYGVHATGNSLRLDFVTQGPYSKNIGSRTYLMSDDYAYEHFHLKNKEFTYTVDDSNLDCGLNGALYFVQMDQDGGKSKFGNAGAELGLGYCDAQCPHDMKFINGEANNEDWKPSETDVNAGSGKYGSCCTEIDIWEANKISTAYTMHPCDGGEQTRCSGTDCGDNGPDRFKGICDKNGCDIQSSRLGNPSFFGPGPDFQIDSTKPITVTTQFITNDGTDTGKLVEVKQFYTQNGKTIEHPEYAVLGNKHKTITESFCADWIGTTKDGTTFAQKGGLAGIEKALDAGVVLVMSLWDDHYANMLWLDSTYPVDSTDPGSKRGTCATTSGAPTEVETMQASAHVIFSDIKFGPLGSTTGGVAPTPSPPSPSPAPSPSGCPGGSLDACIDQCPPDAFAACVSSCQRRCSGEFAI